MSTSAFPPSRSCGKALETGLWPCDCKITSPDDGNTYKKHTDGWYLSLLRYLLGIDVVGQVRGEVAVGVGQRLLDQPQRLVILLGQLDTLLQLLLPAQRLGKQVNAFTDTPKNTQRDTPTLNTGCPAAWRKQTSSFDYKHINIPLVLIFNYSVFVLTHINSINYLH